MEIVLAVLILALALIALAYPLYRAQTQAAFVNASTLDDLLAQRDGVYATLRDLELDQQLGKLDAGDYNALRERYMTRAAEILQELDTLRGQGGGKDASAEIEQEVAALRKKTERRTQTAEKDAAQTTDLHCSNCGRAYKPGDKFCARCGRALA